ncbi:hypothetical protein VHUM_00557 [Vanrija humicola]|uniref:Cupin 2 conserved barrel domain-containing protein n=1 Tax=Vanrija humicola TaxID=5417 RepID=A0A7D8V2L9_VANHU|nr:hypothetical protein VHUM_00557 [Vanrija humicola]
MHGPFRRIITSHTAADTDGSHVAVFDDAPAFRSALDGGAAFTALFATLGLPAVSAHSIDSAGIDAAAALAPAVVTPNGVNCQVTDLAPRFRVAMHRTNSVDYNILLSGSVYLITPDGEGEKRTLVNAGEIVIQRGTVHGWEAGPEGARWVSVIVNAEPVMAGGKPLEEVDFRECVCVARGLTAE